MSCLKTRKLKDINEKLESDDNELDGPLVLQMSKKCNLFMIIVF
jgi:hypothetical protein